MKTRSVLNSALVLGLAAAFAVFFNFTKHDPAYRDILPFGNDPYDAVGSFALVFGAILGLLLLIRLAIFLRAQTPTLHQGILLARTQLTIALTVLITLAADGVAMARFSNSWADTPAASSLTAYIGAMAAFTALAAYTASRFAREARLPSEPRHWMKASAVCLGSIFLLAVYPLNFTDSMVGALATVIVGSILLCAPLAALDLALIPLPLDGQPSIETSKGWISRLSRYRWPIALLAGLATGTILLLGEVTEGAGGIPAAQLALVASVYIGLGTTGLLIGFAFLRRPLGLFEKQ